MGLIQAITVGLKRISDTVKGFYVRDSSGTERAMYDTDGYLYQLGTKLTPAAASFNDMATKAGTETLTNKTLTAPAVNSAVVTSAAIVDSSLSQTTLGAHDYAAGVADWTLSAAELKNQYNQASNASGAVNAIVPTTMRIYYFQNSTGFVLTVKTAAGSGVAIANAKGAFVFCNGTNVIRLSSDA